MYHRFGSITVDYGTYIYKLSSNKHHLNRLFQFIVE